MPCLDVYLAKFLVVTNFLLSSLIAIYDLPRYLLENNDLLTDINTKRIFILIPNNDCEMIHLEDQRKEAGEELDERNSKLGR